MKRCWIQVKYQPLKIAFCLSMPALRLDDRITNRYNKTVEPMGRVMWVVTHP